MTTTWRPDFEFIGGHPALDFANTLRGRLHTQPVDHLDTYAQLREWARQARLLSSADTRRLAKLEANQPAAARRVLAQAVRLREALYSLVSAIAAGAPPPPTSVDAVNAEVSEAASHLRLGWARAEKKMIWAWDDPRCLHAPLWAVAWSAAGLATSEVLHRVRECEAPTCSWLFLDGTRNHSRRWCDTAACGNRERVRRHYERQRHRLRGSGKARRGNRSIGSPPADQ